MKFDPLPHLIGLATAINIGSTGTITDNPQNIYIGAHSGISYFRFAERLLPVAILGVALNYLVVALMYRRRPSKSRQTNDSGSPKAPDESGVGRSPRSRAHPRLQIKAITITLVAVGPFFTSLPLELVVLGAAAAVLLDRINPKKIYNQVDWSLLVMFMGLFIVVHAFQVCVVEGWDIERWTWLLNRPNDMLSLVSAVLSNLVSNVPAVLLLEPVAQAMPAATQENISVSNLAVETHCQII